MFASIRRVGIASFAFAAAACSGDGSGDNQGNQATGSPDPSATNAPPGPVVEQPGCTKLPSCGSCGTCADECFCYLQDIVECSNQCSVVNTPGAGGSGGWIPPASGGAASFPGPGGAPGGAGAPVTFGGAPAVGAGGTPDQSNGGAPDVGSGGTSGTVLPPGVQTFQFTSDSFTLPPGGEAFKCQNFRNTIGKDAAVVVSESFMSPGSHHMFVFPGTQYNADSPMADCSGVEFHDYIHVAQVPQAVITYPAGVGRSLPGASGLRILAHYLNPSADSLTAQVTIKLHYLDTSGVQYLAAQMFLNQALLSVPPGASTKSRSFSVPYNIRMLQAVSHMHKHGVHFKSTTSTGQVLYDGTDWDEPQDVTWNPGLDIAAGASINWTCDYANDTGKTLTFGESAATNEMCILNAVFYPTTPGQHQGVPLDSQF